MSTKCVFRVDGKPKVHKSIGGFSQTTTPTKRICGKEIQAFVRVEYSELYHHRARDGKYYDVFGFCAPHGSEILKGVNLGNATQWEDLRGLRGYIKTMTAVAPSDVLDPKMLALQEQKLRLMAD